MLLYKALCAPAFIFRSFLPGHPDMAPLFLRM